MGQTQSLLFDVIGEYKTYPTLRVQPTAQRAAPTSLVGWKWRRRYAITNGGTQAEANRAFALDLGLTNGLVSGSKGQADNDDLRVWISGREVARTLVNWNDATYVTLCWIVIPFLPAGGVLNIDVVYGNSAATTAPILTAGLDLPAFDVQTAGANRSTNTKWIYKQSRVAANAGKGAWPLSSGTTSPMPYFAVPGAWQLATTTLTDDDRKQSAATAFVDTLAYYIASFDAIRSRSGSLILASDNGADGVSLRVPSGVVSVRADMHFENPARNENDATPIGKLIIASRSGEGDPWHTFYENATTPVVATPTIADTTYTLSAVAPEVAFAVWPYDGHIIDRASRADRYIAASWYSVLEVNLQSGVLVQSTVQAETEIYEIATEVRSLGGGDAVGVPPYTSILIGNPKATSGVGSLHLGVELSQQVVIDTEKRTFAVWNSALTVRVENIPLDLVRVVDGVLDVNGVLVERAAVDWMPWTPQVDVLTNSSFDTNASGWTRGTVTAGVTAAAAARSTATFDTTPASGLTTITPNTAGVNAIVEDIASDYLPVGDRDNVQVGIAVRSDNVNIQVTPSIWFYDEAQVFLSKAIQADWTVTADVWARRLLGALVPVGAYSYRVGVTHKLKSAGVTGLGRWDTLAVNDTEVALLDVAIGAITLSAQWQTRYA